MTLLSKKILKLISASLLFCLLINFLFSDFANIPTQAFNKLEQPKLSLGGGLNSVAGWSPSLPFLNLFKANYGWLTVPKGSTEWNSGEFDKLDLDQNGWPKNMSGMDAIHTLFMHSSNSSYEPGRYIVRYEGEGTILFRNYDNPSRVRLISEESIPGRAVIEITEGMKDGINLRITSTDPNNTGNYIRNIEVIYEPYLELVNKGEIFNPRWLATLTPYRALRFMDWMSTNNSTQSTWENRPTPGYYRFSGGKGVPLEIMVALANKIHVDPYFNMPHLATDDYMINFAEYVKENLHPSLQVYVELSNEVWNGLFSQYNHADTQGKTLFGNSYDSRFSWYGMRVDQMCKIWQGQGGVFSQNPDRVNCILAGQTAWQETFEKSLECPKWVALGNPPCYENIDSVAITGYFSGGLASSENQAIVKTWVDDFKNAGQEGLSRTFEQLANAKYYGQDGVAQSLQKNFDNYGNLANQYGKELLAYEGGQHITGNLGELQENQDYTNYFMAVNRDPRMYDIYKQVLEAWENDPIGNRTIFMHFVELSGFGKHGSWGALENLSQLDNGGSSKFNALDSIQCFNDIDNNFDFKNFICNLKEDKVISGYGNGEFIAGNNVTRGQMAKFIMNAFKIPENLTCDSFSDVPSTYDFYKHIQTLKCSGIINGFPDGNFRPEIPVTRGAATKFVINSKILIENNPNLINDHENVSEFPDVPSNHDFYNYIMSAGKNKIVNGYPDGFFRPDNFISRGEMSKIIDRARKI